MAAHDHPDGPPPSLDARLAPEESTVTTPVQACAGTAHVAAWVAEAAHWTLTGSVCEYVRESENVPDGGAVQRDAVLAQASEARAIATLAMATSALTAPPTTARVLLGFRATPRMVQATGPTA